MLRDAAPKAFNLQAATWAKLGRLVAQIPDDDAQAVARWNQGLAAQGLSNDEQQRLTIPAGKELGEGLALLFSSSSDLRSASSRLSAGQTLRFSALAKILFGDGEESEAALAGLISISIRARMLPHEFSLLPARYHFFTNGIDNSPYD